MRQIILWLSAHRRFVPVIFVFFIVVLAIILADIDQKVLIMRLVEGAPYGDKLAHFFLFGLLAATLNSALLYRQVLWPVPIIQLGSLLVLAFAWGEEVSQLAFDSRTFDFGDMFADLLGVWVAQFFAIRR